MGSSSKKLVFTGTNDKLVIGDDAPRSRAHKGKVIRCSDWSYVWLEGQSMALGAPIGHIVDALISMAADEPETYEALMRRFDN